MNRPVIHPFVPPASCATAVEVQWLGPDHCLHRMAPHGHTFFELIVIIRGVGRHVIDGQSFDAHRGTLFVVPPWAIHDGRPLSTAAGWVVLFRADSVPTFDAATTVLGSTPPGPLFAPFREPSSAMLRPLVLDEPALHQVVDLVERIDSELHRREAGYRQAVESALQLLLIGVARQTARVSATAQEAIPSSRATIDAIFADIDAHFRHAPSLVAASRRLGLSPGYLTTVLRRATKRTYGDWVIERRMIEARRLLAGGTARIAEIAEAIGYAETESFNRRFRERHGMSPSSWRRSVEARANPGQEKRKARSGPQGLATGTIRDPAIDRSIP